MFCIGDFIIKWLLIIGNFLFALAGLGIIGLGVTGLVVLNQIEGLLPDVLNTVSIVIIVLGVIIFIISFLACCGAMQESMCMLISYSVCMLILAAIKIYMAIVMFGFLSDGQNTVDGWINTAFNNQGIRGVFKVLESIFRCCGVNGPNSYIAEGSDIPDSCCANPIGDQCAASESYGGCSDMVADWFVTFGNAVGIVIITVIVVEVVCMIFGLNLAVSARNKNRRKQFV